MEEMMDDTLAMEDDEELEEEADAEVDKVLFELTDGKLGLAGSVGTALPVSTYSARSPTCLILSLACGGQTRRRGRADDGAVSPAVKRVVKQLEGFYNIPTITCIHTRTLPCTISRFPSRMKLEWEKMSQQRAPSALCARSGYQRCLFWPSDL